MGKKAKEYIKDIAELLKDTNKYVHGRAAWTLGRMGAKECAKDITVLLKDRSYHYAKDTGKYEPVTAYCGVCRHIAQEIEKLEKAMQSDKKETQPEDYIATEGYSFEQETD